MQHVDILLQSGPRRDVDERELPKLVEDRRAPVSEGGSREIHLGEVGGTTLEEVHDHGRASMALQNEIP